MLTLTVQLQTDGWYFLWGFPEEGSAPNADFSGPFDTLEECLNAARIVAQENGHG